MARDDTTFTALVDEPIDVAALMEWCRGDHCGAIDVFCGTVRDHAPGREGVRRLDYHAHPTQAENRLASVADGALERWPMIGRIALVHRVGSLVVGEVAVAVVVATPHRDEAFAASRWCIDTLKATVPLWKYEVWSDGEGWGTCGHDLIDVADLDHGPGFDGRIIAVGT